MPEPDSPCQELALLAQHHPQINPFDSALHCFIMLHACMCERNSEPGLGEIKKLAERLARIFVELYPDLNARMITERTKEWENPIRHTGLVRSKIVDQMVEAHILGDLPKAIASTNVSHEEYSHAGETVRECLRSVRCWAGVGSVVPMRLYEGWLLQHIHNLREHAWHKAQKLRGELPTPPAAN